jgi:hypothetical protein
MSERMSNLNTHELKECRESEEKTSMEMKSGVKKNPEGWLKECYRDLKGTCLMKDCFHCRLEGNVLKENLPVKEKKEEKLNVAYLYKHGNEIVGNEENSAYVFDE